jgi:hypothetical protein
MDSRAITAWIAAAMLLAQASLELFAVSRHTLRESHIVLGRILLPLTFAHAGLSMKSVSMKSDNMAGLWLAAARYCWGVPELLGIALIRPSEVRAPLGEFTCQRDRAFSLLPACVRR